LASEQPRDHDYEPEESGQASPENIPASEGEANPNAGGPQRLEGDMGISSERPGPRGGDRRTDRGVEGTGTTYSTAATTDGEMETFPGGEDLPRDKDAERPADEGRGSGVDRTVGEDNTAEVPPHALHRNKNPGHSHGT